MDVNFLGAGNRTSDDRVQALPISLDVVSFTPLVRHAKAGARIRRDPNDIDPRAKNEDPGVLDIRPLFAFTWLLDQGLLISL